MAAIANLGGQLHRNIAAGNSIAAWDAMVTAAQANHFVVSNPSGTMWAPQDFLAHWHQANTGLPVS